jgi:tetrahydromethanopterin S-methyltransferase subunit B
MSWRSVLKLGGKAAKWAGRGAKAAVETGGKALLHPQQTLKGAGTALKTAAVGGGLGYVGWKKLTTDESVVGIVSDAIIGKETTDKVSETVHGAVDGIRDLKESVGNMTEKVSGAAENVDGKLNGISSFLSDVSSGNGGEMMGGFFQNLTHGNVSGMGVMGLVLSAFLVFGRFGWMAKLAGAMLAMMTIGNNSQRELSPAAVQADPARLAQAKDMRQAEPPEVEQIHRRR